MNNTYNNNKHNHNQHNHQRNISMNNSHNQHDQQIINNLSNVKSVSEINTIKKTLMKNISVAIVLLVVVYGGYLTFKNKITDVAAKKDVNEEIDIKAESYVLLNNLASKLNFKNSNIEKYPLDWEGGKYDGYAISTVSYVGVEESPFNDELKKNDFIEGENNLAEGHTAGLAVYSKDNLICIIKNDAVNPNSWGTNNPDYSSTQTFACANKNK